MIDWHKIELSVLDGYAEQMRQVQQSPLWHGEGDAYAHTMMVCEALKALPEYQALPELQKHIVYTAALLHDIGKIATTRLEMGEWKAPHHAPIGSRMARKLLWTEYGLCGDAAMQVREAICQLIRYHSFPPHAIDMENARLRLHMIAAGGLLAPDFSVRLLCLLAKADMLGRQCADQQQMLDNIALCEELAKEEGCYESCYPFATEYTRRAYFSGADVWKDQELFDDTWGEVVLMSGLPGTGKDTWIGKNLPDLPVVSLDEIRRARKISPKADQGNVANLAREQAKEYLRLHQPFVWNATNITAQMRESLVSLFETYHARVRIVYLETDWQTQLDRNSNREHSVPRSEIEKMLDKLTPPESHEAYRVEWVTAAEGFNFVPHFLFTS